MPQQQSTFNEEPELTPEEMVILENLMKGESFKEITPTKILPRQKHSPVVLSFAQQRLWIIHQLVPGNPFYNMSSIFRFSREINVRVFERSLNEVVRRHESLRTVFTIVDQEPMQVILSEMKPGLQVLDLRGLCGLDQEREINRLAAEEFAKPFDLEAGPLVRAILLSTGNNEHVLLFIMHHIISDGWSMEIFFREMMLIYEVFSAGKPLLLAEPSIQYADFALWQRQRLVGEVLEKQLSYWKKVLGGKLPILELPIDRQRPAVQAYQGSLQRFELSGILSRSLMDLTRQQRRSLFMTLLAAFNVLLYCYSGQEDILVGAPTANRNRPELEELIGFFANTLVFRTNLAGNSIFIELLDMVSKAAAKAFDNQDLPFEKLVEELQPDRYMSHSPIFQVMFNFQNTPGTGIKSMDFGKSVLPIHNKTSKFDLWVSMSWQEEKLAGAVEYNTDIFDHSTITRLIDHFNILLSAITKNPGRRINDLSILSAGEKKQLLEEWNDTAREYSLRCIHHLFGKQVKKTADNIALVGLMRLSAGKKERNPEPGQLTYQELDEKSNGMAYLLRQRGVGPDTVVGILVERSVEMVSGLLGILKAGGAYMPLDPDCPGERINYMLKDSGVKVLVTTRELAGEVNKNLEVIFIESVDFFGCSSSYFFDSVFHVVNLAYVIYTSGSTGNPKGVMVSHEGICNRLLWMQETFRLNCDDCVLQKTPFSFDVSVWEFYWPLLNGAVLVMARPGGHKDSVYLVEVIIKQKITTIHFVPSMLQVFLEEPGLKELTLLRRIISSGEILPMEYQQRFFDCIPGGVQLYNLYGPTEASVDVTYWHCVNNDRHRSVPIGRPVANTWIYILDLNLKFVPIGVHGELYIGGIQLARGYLNQPELTAEKFIEKVTGAGDRCRCINKKFLRGGPGGAVFSKSAPPGRRRQKIYKTGDLVRWLVDGNIEFIGRLDFQVKVRGFRIELGEIESKLRNHLYVEDAVVLAGEANPGSGHKKLIAYIVPNRDHWALPGSRMGSGQDQVLDWQGVFNDTYSQEVPGQDPYFNILGWNSSYSGELIPAVEMGQWVEGAVERILGFKPCRVLEIGCGTGLLLFKIIPHCEFYQGTDISLVGLDYIRQRLALSSQHDKQNLAMVELLNQAADDFRGIEREAFDLVIINSVVQYFPGIDYLLKVMRGAVAALKPGGSIFIGDVRSLSLLEAFHVSVEFYREKSNGAASGETSFTNMTRNQLKRRVMKRMYQEKELVIDPVFFTVIGDGEGFSRVKSVGIHLKPGRYRNELIKFRYDVVLRVDSEDYCEIDILFLDWQKENLTLSRVRRLLEENKPESLGISGIPDARTAEDLRVLKWLKARDHIETVGQMLESPVYKPKPGIDPGDFRGLEREIPYDIDMNISSADVSQARDNESEYRYDVVFKRRDLPGKVVYRARVGKGKQKRQSGKVYANDPLWAKKAAELEVELKDFLKEKLPGYMVPFYFIMVEALPLEPNGKLDRRALPQPDPIMPEQEKDFVEPVTGIEKLFSGIWSRVLNLEKISITNNFFQLGGDSIKAIQIISRINQEGYNLSLKDLYQYQSIDELARYAERMKKQSMKEAGQEETLSIDDLYMKLDREEIARELGPKIEIEDIYPVTPLQHHMLNYYNSQGNQEPALYVFQRNSPRLHLHLEISLLKQAVEKVTEHNALLRTVFFWEGLKEPVQVVCKKGEISFIYRDMSKLFAEKQDQRFEELMKEQWNCKFHLNKPLALRLVIVKLGEGIFQYFFTGDYIRIDGWSANAVINQVLESYFALYWGRDLDLPIGNNIYKYYLYRLKKQEAGGAKDYWRNALKGFTSPTPLISRFPGNKPGQGEGFARQHIYLPEGTTAELGSFLQKNQLVLSTIGQGIWALLLSSYTNETDVVFGALSSGRSIASAGVETMIGYSINVLPVRVKIEPDELVVKWLKQIWNNHMEWSRYEYTRIDHINDWCGISGEERLFESYIVIQNLPKKTGSIKEKPVESKSAHLFYAKMEYPLRLDIYPLPGICLVLTYYRRGFVDSLIKGLLENFRALVESIIENPTKRVRELMSQIGAGKYTVPNPDKGESKQI